MATNRPGMGGVWVGNDLVQAHLRAGGSLTVKECAEAQDELFGGTSRMFLLKASGISVTVTEGELSTLYQQWPGRLHRARHDSQAKLF